MHLKPFPVKRQRKRRMTGPTANQHVNRAYNAKKAELRRYLRSHMLPVRYQP